MAKRRKPSYRRAQRDRMADLPMGIRHPEVTRFDTSGLTGYTQSPGSPEIALLRQMDRAGMADLDLDAAYGTHDTVNVDGDPITVTTDPEAIEETVLRFQKAYGGAL